jgi:hypothetical protein
VEGASRIHCVRNLDLSAAPEVCPLHHALYGARSPSRGCAGEVSRKLSTNAFA